MTSESRARLTPRYIAYCRRRPFELQVTLQPRGLLSLSRPHYAQHVSSACTPTLQVTPPPRDWLAFRPLPRRLGTATDREP
jgi:hypothetical protein